MSYAYRLAALLAMLGINMLGWGIWLGLAGWWLGWLGLNLLWLAVCYAWVGPRGLGKRSDGRQYRWCRLLLAPWLGVQWLLWRAQDAWSQDAAWHQITETLILGRRLRPGQWPEGVDAVIDMTAEFGASWRPEGSAYACWPTLDALAPIQTALETLVARRQAEEGIWYVHCASGHGRSATVLVALLWACGEVADVQAGEARVRAIRPGVMLSSVQRQTLEAWVTSG